MFFKIVKIFLKYFYPGKSFPLKTEKDKERRERIKEGKEGEEGKKVSVLDI